jgi:hypothetical protein
MPDTLPGLTFDKNGVCNHCRDYKPIKYHGEDKLNTILEDQKKKGKKYDCMVMISGGRDSSYIILKLVRDYGMKVLAINYENPFTDPQAKKNIQNIVDILKVDLLTFKLKNNLHEKTFKNNFSAWTKKPSPALIPMICISCKTMLYEITKAAKKYDIDCIVSGGNPIEFTSFKTDLLNVKDNTNIDKKFIYSLYGIVKESSKNLDYYRPVCLSTMFMGYLFGDPFTLGSRLYGHNIKRVEYFHYVPWDENTVLSRIRSELNWECPKHLHSTWRFDCMIGHVKDYMYLKTISASEKDDFYSKMIREGRMTREDALKRLENENIVYYDDLNKVMKIAGMENTNIIEKI